MAANKPLLRDDVSLYRTLLDEMFHEYIVSDTFCSFSRDDREQRVGAFEEIRAHMDTFNNTDNQTDIQKIA